jgi:hypothetical protein
VVPVLETRSLGQVRAFGGRALALLLCPSKRKRGERRSMMPERIATPDASRTSRQATAMSSFPTAGLVAERFARQEVAKIPYDEPQNRPGENGERKRVAEHERERAMGRVSACEAADQDQRDRRADSERRPTQAIKPPAPGKYATEDGRSQRHHDERATSIGRREWTWSHPHRSLTKRRSCSCARNGTASRDCVSRASALAG